jgi:hypothetical protein
MSKSITVALLAQLLYRDARTTTIHPAASGQRSNEQRPKSLVLGDGKFMR